MFSSSELPVYDEAELTIGTCTTQGERNNKNNGQNILLCYVVPVHIVFDYVRVLQIYLNIKNL
jgi:hypothetical protein